MLARGAGRGLWGFAVSGEISGVSMGKVWNLGETPSLITHILSELRDSDHQRSRPHFRENMERLGIILGYEVSKTLRYEIKDVKTPLGRSLCHVLSQKPVVATI